MSRRGQISTQVKEAMKEGLDLQEISWCETYLKTLSIKQACSESGLRIDQAHEMLKKESVKTYIMQRSDQYRQALESDKKKELTRDNISNVLETIISDPLTPVEMRLRAITQLNSMKEFDKRNDIKDAEEGREEVEIEISAEEAEKLLAELRTKKY